MSGLLGPMVAPGITPDSGQGQLATAISSFFGGGTPQFQTPTPQAPAPAPDPTYDKWGHVVTGSPQGQVQGQMPQAQAPSPVPSLNTGPGLAPAAAQGVGASGYDQWGRQAPVAPQPQAAPQLPGLADIMKLIQQYQAQQALLNANAPQGLLGGNETGGDQGSADHGGADSGVI